LGFVVVLSYVGAVENSYAKHYRPTKHFAVNEIIVSFKGSHLQTVYTKETQAVWVKALQAL
jgi:hypothetical protein